MRLTDPVVGFGFGFVAQWITLFLVELFNCVPCKPQRMQNGRLAAPNDLLLLVLTLLIEALFSLRLIVPIPSSFLSC